MDVDLAAQLRALLEQYDFVPSQRSDARRLHATGPTTDHDDPLALFGGREGAVAECLLIAGCRVDGAGDMPLATGVAHAALVAGDAGPDLLRLPQSGLLRQERIGDGGPGHAHKVRLSRFDNLIGHGHVLDPAHRGNGHEGALLPQRLLHALGGMHLVAGRDSHWRHDHEQGWVHADANIQVVQLTRRDQPLGDLHALGQCVASRDEFVGADSHAQDAVVSQAVAGRLHYLKREPHAVLQRASVLIVATVRGGRHELCE